MNSHKVGFHLRPITPRKGTALNFPFEVTKGFHQSDEWFTAMSS